MQFMLSSYSKNNKTKLWDIKNNIIKPLLLETYPITLAVNHEGYPEVEKLFNKLYKLLPLS